MKPKFSRALVALIPIALAPWAFGAVAKSDIATPEGRHASVEVAMKLAQPAKPVPVAMDLKTPFNPAGFDRPDSEEQQALAATVAAIQGNVKIRSPREILEAVALRIQPEGTTSDLRGRPILYFLKKPYRIGDKFTIKDQGIDYEVTLTAIDRSTFTLRYRNEEFTRSISKSGKN